MIIRNRVLKIVQLFNCWLIRIATIIDINIFKTERKYYDVSKTPIFFENRSRISGASGSLARSLRKNAQFPAGKLISFWTNSKCFTVKLIYRKISIISNMSIRFVSATDIKIKSNYKEERYTMYSNTPYNVSVERNFCGTRDRKYQVCIYLPSYACVSKLYIGVEKDAKIWSNTDNNKTIVFYGSSITQGCCASSPLSCYTNIVADYFGYSLLNFGFSESAKGEKNVIEFIASFDAALFIIEYDHNAEYDLFKKNHFTVYELIRAAHADTPIIFLSRFSGGMSISNDEEDNRINVIRQTVKKAKKQGDDNVYFISGKDVIPGKSNCFVDDRHPNDRGMKIIANHIIEYIEENGVI